MRASKLITISTAAILMGGTGLAVGHSPQSGQSQNQNNASAQAPAAFNQANAQAADQGSKLKGSRQYQRSPAMTTQRDQASSTQRGRAITTARGEAMIERDQGITRGQGGSERGRAAAAYEPQPAVHARQSLRQTGGPVYARASASEVRGSLTPEQRAHLRELARRELPRVSHIPEVRVNAIVPRDVELAPVPGEIARYYPQFRHNQAFLYHNRIVLVDPATSRIVGVIPA